VWRIVRRGRKPSETAWRVTENAPEITACDAITVANVASTTIGIRLHSGKVRKNGLEIVAGSSVISAPCPRYCSVSAGNTRKNHARRIGLRPKWPMSA
jgi:hypothetical protein